MCFFTCESQCVIVIICSDAANWNKEEEEEEGEVKGKGRGSCERGYKEDLMWYKELNNNSSGSHMCAVNK